MRAKKQSACEDAGCIGQLMHQPDQEISDTESRNRAIQVFSAFRAPSSLLHSRRSIHSLISEDNVMTPYHVFII